MDNYLEGIKKAIEIIVEEQTTEHENDNARFVQTMKRLQGIVSNRLDGVVMPLLIKDEIAQKLIDRLNLYEKQYASDYGFINKQKIAHKVKELKKCIQIVQSA